MKIDIDIEGYDEERFATRVAELALAKIENARGEDTIERQIRTRVERAVDRHLEHYTVEKIRAEVDRVVAEGWQGTNNYGEPTGKVVGFKERIAEVLMAPDGYGNDRASRLTKMAKEALDRALQTVFKEEVEAARLRFREAVDTVLQAKLVDVLRTSLGIPK